MGRYFLADFRMVEDLHNKATYICNMCCQDLFDMPALVPCTAYPQIRFVLTYVSGKPLLPMLHMYV